MFPWTGDVSRSWGGLQPQVELSLQMGMMGMGYTHSDLGGFAGGETFDKEMYIRWLQYGVFQPVFRPHAQENAKPEPIFHDTETKDILREYVKLRYQLMPYIYSLSIENSLTGMPIMRPMFFEDEANLSLIDEKDSYFYGDSLLVAPVTEQGARSVNMNLPSGTWFNFWNDKRYQGSQKVTVDAPLTQTPVLVRAGAFIPMVDAVQSTKDYNTKNLTLHYYADSSVKSSSSTMYNDDGKDPKSLVNDNFETLSFTATHADKQLSIELQRRGQYMTMPAQRTVNLVIHNWLDGAKHVYISGKKIKLLSNVQQYSASESGAWYNNAKQQLQVKFNWQQSIKLVVN
jgi:oligosaccharide 4-alpha-D-glucosyltransferase